MPHPDSSDATLVIPVYNEAGGIRDAILSLLAQEWIDTMDVIVVDDASTDGTHEILSNLHKERGGFLLLAHEENSGYGASLKTGIREASTEWIIITDADNSYPNHRIPELLDKAVQGRHDMVVGARTKANVQIPLVRRPAKWVLNKMANYLADRTIPDLNSGLRVFRRQIALDFFDLLSNRFSFTTGITLIMLCHGFRVHYEPIEYYKRTGKSKIQPIRDTIRFTSLILTTAYCFRPLRVLLPPALLLFFVGTGWGLYTAIFERHVMTSTLLLIQTGMSLFVMAFLSDLVVRSRNIHRSRNRDA